MNEPADTMRRIAKAMETNVASPLDINAMARTAGYSKFHFYRLFKKHVGYTPSYYQSLLRDSWAMKLLRETDLSPLLIANTIGYSSVGTFARRFKRRYGMNMGTYRAIMKHFDTVRKADVAASHQV